MPRAHVHIKPGADEKAANATGKKRKMDVEKHPIRKMMRGKKKPRNETREEETRGKDIGRGYAKSG